MLSQHRGHNRRARGRAIKEIERIKNAKRVRKEKGERKKWESGERARPFNCSWSPMTEYTTWRVLLPSFHPSRKPPLVPNLCRSSLSASCPQASPQGTLVCRLGTVAAWHGVVLSVPGGKQTTWHCLHSPSLQHNAMLTTLVRGLVSREAPKGPGDTVFFFCVFRRWEPTVAHFQEIG